MVLWVLIGVYLLANVFALTLCWAAADDKVRR